MSKVSQKLQIKLHQLQTAREMLRQEKDALRKAERLLDACLEAQSLIQSAAAEMQSIVHQKISLIVTRCLSLVFDDAYSFHIHFDKKRGKTEARMVFIDSQNKEIDPTTEAGGGVVDVAAFALRISAVVLTRPSRSKLLVLDEPFRFVSRSYSERVKQLLETLSNELGFQIIMITHDPLLEAGTVVNI